MGLERRGGQVRALKVEIKRHPKHHFPQHTIKVLVDEFPEARFTRKGDLWFGEKDGYVQFYGWTGPGNEGGFGGRHFPITMEDGNGVVLKGPWSSRPGEMNAAGFTPCVDVSITDDPVKWEQQFFYDGNVTVEWLQAALDEHCPGERLVEVANSAGEPVWRLSDG